MHRWQSELERIRSKALFFEAQANASIDGIIVVDENGQKIYQNQRANELWSIPPHIVEDPDVWSQIEYVTSLVKDPEGFGKLLRQLYKEPESTNRTEVELKSGIVLDRYTAPVHDTDGRYYGRIWTFRDITERKRNEEALQAAHAELEARVAQRTEALSLALEEVERANKAKTEFLSRMSHELRTPLNAILGFGQLLEMDDITELQRESIGLILKAGNHLLGLINEILDIAALESGNVMPEIEAVSVGDVIAEMCALVEPLAANREVAISTEGAEAGRFFILGDRRRLKQVLINLLSNGIKYNRQGGTLRISCADTGCGYIRISVTDTGAGIAREDIAKLFTPFERLDAFKSEVQGTGLGLVIAQRLVAAMSGTLEVNSEVGKGSTFSIELPTAESPESAAGVLAEPAVAAKQAGGTDSTVLCIEDNESNLKLVEVILHSQRRARLISATRGAAGIDLAKESRPNLILLDLNLPDMHGFDVLSQLRDDPRTKDIPIVVTSADATEYQIERMLAGGAAAYLTKPLNLCEFLQTLDAHIGREAA